MNINTLNDIVVLCQKGKMTKEHHSYQELVVAVAELAMQNDFMADAKAQPAHIRTCCEKCGTLHVDKGEWAKEPHKRHQCENCGLIWQPALYPTIGVQFLNEPG
jgi:hypothetical protein